MVPAACSHLKAGEQRAKIIMDGRADIFLLCCVLDEMLKAAPMSGSGLERSLVTLVALL
jgi:hypothetical protein